MPAPDRLVHAAGAVQPAADPNAPKWDGVQPLRTGVVVRWKMSPIASQLAKLNMPVISPAGIPSWNCDVYPRPGSNNFGVWITLVPIADMRRHPDAAPFVVPKFTSVEQADEWLASHALSE